MIIRTRKMEELCQVAFPRTHGHIFSSSSIEVANPRSMLSVTTFNGSVHLAMSSEWQPSLHWQTLTNAERSIKADRDMPEMEASEEFDRHKKTSGQL